MDSSWVVLDTVSQVPIPRKKCMTWQLLLGLVTCLYMRLRFYKRHSNRPTQNFHHIKSSQLCMCACHAGLEWVVWSYMLWWCRKLLLSFPCSLFFFFPLSLSLSLSLSLLSLSLFLSTWFWMFISLHCLWKSMFLHVSGLELFECHGYRGRWAKVSEDASAVWTVAIGQWRLVWIDLGDVHATQPYPHEERQPSLDDAYWPDGKV